VRLKLLPGGRAKRVRGTAKSTAAEAILQTTNRLRRFFFVLPAELPETCNMLVPLVDGVLLLKKRNIYGCFLQVRMDAYFWNREHFYFPDGFIPDALV